MKNAPNNPTSRPAGSRISARPPCRAAALLAAILASLILSSCQSPDPVVKAKDRPLGPDERYLVDYYMKIIEFEKQLHENPALREEKRLELERGLDTERIRRALAELDKKPERWLAIYNRINELQLRAAESPPTEKR